MIRRVVLLSSVVPTPASADPSGAFADIQDDLTGAPHADAIVTALIADYPRVSARPKPTADSLRDLTGTSVTLAAHTITRAGARQVFAAEGTIALDETGSPVLAGRRPWGMTLPPDQVLDVEIGLGRIDVLRERVEQVRATLPVVQELTRAHLLALPDDAPDPAQIGLAVFGTWQVGDTVGPGAVWLLHSYQREDDIAEGYLLLRPEAGYSEHGSVPGEYLLRACGRIVDAPAMSLSEAFDLRDLPYEQALARFVTIGDGPA